MRIKFYCLLIFAVSIFVACSDDAGESEFTNRSIVYPLLSGSVYNTSGTVTFQEKRDSSLQVTIEIGPTDMNVLHPAHLHYGPYQEDAEMAAMLTPVDGKTGKSITNIKRLAGGALFTFEALLDFDGHVKVHGDNGPNKDLILAYGNVGINAP